MLLNTSIFASISTPTVHSPYFWETITPPRALRWVLGSGLTNSCSLIPFWGLALIGACDQTHLNEIWKVVGLSLQGKTILKLKLSGSSERTSRNKFSLRLDMDTSVCSPGDVSRSYFSQDGKPALAITPWVAEQKEKNQTSDNIIKPPSQINLEPSSFSELPVIPVNKSCLILRTVWVWFLVICSGTCSVN